VSKSRYKPSGVGSLLGGMIALGVAIIAIGILYGYMAGLSQGGAGIVIQSSGLAPIFTIIFLMVIVGFFGGFSVGLYFEAQRPKWLESLAQKRSRYAPPPPPEET